VWKSQLVIECTWVRVLSERVCAQDVFTQLSACSVCSVVGYSNEPHRCGPSSHETQAGLSGDKKETHLNNEYEIANEGQRL
jgi:hypothetical protein